MQDAVIDQLIQAIAAGKVHKLTSPPAKAIEARGCAGDLIDPQYLIPGFNWTGHQAKTTVLQELWDHWVNRQRQGLHPIVFKKIMDEAGPKDPKCRVREGVPLAEDQRRSITIGPAGPPPPVTNPKTDEGLQDDDTVRSLWAKTDTHTLSQELVDADAAGTNGESKCTV